MNELEQIAHLPTAAAVARLQAMRLGAAVEPALLLAARCNQQRMRPLSDQPYLLHLVEVALQIASEFSIHDEIATVVALWHDLLEDNQISAAELQAYCGQHSALRRLGDLLPLLEGLNRQGKTVEQYYAGIAALPPQAFWVKASDLLSNTRMMPLLQWEHLKPEWIAKYTVEIAREVLDVGRFETKRGYQTIRAALLDVQQRLLRALKADKDRWYEVALLDPRFSAAAQDLLQRST